MKIIREVICPHCGKKQVRDKKELLQSDLFWKVCEFCRRYGLELVIRRKFTLRELMEAFYHTLGFRVIQTEASLKDLLKDRSRL